MGESDRAPQEWDRRGKVQSQSGNAVVTDLQKAHQRNLGDSY